jgi:hypothetical protein
MSENITFQKEVYDKTSYSKVVDTQFSQLKSPSLPQELDDPTENTKIEDFFQSYEDLFYSLPESGEYSHQQLIIQSSEYIGYNANQEEIEALQNEISQLREQILELQKSSLNGQQETEQPSQFLGGTSINSSPSNATNPSSTY